MLGGGRRCFKALSDTQTPQGVLALVRQYHYTLEQAAGTKDGKPALLMILEHLGWEIWERLSGLEREQE